MAELAGVFARGLVVGFGGVAVAVGAMVGVGAGVAVGVTVAAGVAVAGTSAGITSAEVDVLQAVSCSMRSERATTYSFLHFIGIPPGS